MLSRHQYLLLILFISAFHLVGCKKDTIHPSKIVKLDSHTTDRLNNILFINNNIGFVVGGQRFTIATILRTIDGGNTWSKYDIPEAGKGVYGITQAPGGRLYACAFDSKLLHSDDLGESWQVTQLNYQPCKNIVFTTAQTGIIIAGVSFNTGTRTYINDQYQITRVDSMGYELNDIDMVTSQTGYIAAMGLMLKTIDGGQHWDMLSIKNDDFNSISDHNKTELWVCGYGGSVWHTTNGGDNWERLRNGNDITLPRYKLLHILFKDSQNGWATGEDGLLIYTNDGGHHWMEYDHFTDDALRGLAIAPDGAIVVAGDNGTLYKIYTN